jgi:glutathione S-transferase
LASATAACDKAIAISYERRRPSERIFVDWIARCWTQLDAVLAELDSFKRSSWPVHDRLMQTDITTACMLGYVRRVEPGALQDGRYPYLELNMPLMTEAKKITAATRSNPATIFCSG